MRGMIALACSTPGQHVGAVALPRQLHALLLTKLTLKPYILKVPAEFAGTMQPK